MLRGLDKTLHIGEGLWGLPRPHPDGGGARALPNFVGSFLLMCTPFVAELYKI